jgi:hypothetical protein
MGILIIVLFDFVLSKLDTEPQNHLVEKLISNLTVTNYNRIIKKRIILHLS